jgi:NitT/TauT family transport system ATP-binding protein
MEPILSIENVSYSYHTPQGETPALNNISFSVLPGSFTSIVGPSGCGKSTLLSLIAGITKPEEGQILIKNMPLQAKTAHIGYMLQRDTLLEWRSIYKNIMLGLEVTHECTKEKRKLVNDMIDSYGLSQFRNAHPSQLSGGMRQRAALIRTLAMEPDILLLDEPFSALDYQTRLEVSDDIARIIKEQHQTAILVTHDISEAIAMGERVIVLSKRPAVIKDILDINLSIENRTPFTSRSAPEFSAYFNKIWTELAT